MRGPYEKHVSIHFNIGIEGNNAICYDSAMSIKVENYYPAILKKIDCRSNIKRENPSFQG